MPDRITHDILAEIVEIAADAIICMDAFQRITFFNKGAEAIFGWTSAEIVGQRIETLIPERYRSSHPRHVAEFGRSQVTARRMGERREIAGVRKNGEEFPAEAAIAQVHQAGDVVYSVVLRDVTVRKRFEQRQQFLAEAGEKLASAFGSSETLNQVARLAVPTMADGCILENRIGNGFLAGAAAHVDPAIEEMLDEIGLAGARVPLRGHPLTEILAKPLPVLLQSQAASRLLEASATPAYIKAVRAMNPQSALFLPLVAREQLIGALTLFRTSRGFDGDDLGFAEDLARLAALALDNARLHDTVRASLRSRDEMLGVVSHDLRNPVAAVKMLSRTLLGSQENDGTQAHESIALIFQAAEQMDALIRDLLDVNRLDAGNLVISTVPVEPSALLTDSLQTLRPLVEEKGIDLDLQIEDVVAVLHYEDLRDVILVVQDGGMVVTGVADRATDRIGRLVYLDAANPVNGQSLVDIAGPLMNVARDVGQVVDGIELVLWPAPEAGMFYGVTDPDDLAWMADRLTPHPWRCFEQPLVLTNEAALWAIPQYHIVCTSTLATRDRELIDRARREGRLWDIDTGHDLMITEPNAVAGALLEIAQ
jgi:PAS domain S-box-containing protein